ncbi:YHS domain-containing protein [Candidatus Poribacteria bacterium]|nr:YHS domain-containing protein [Candidatus Poribacteria bacterium]
MERGVKNVFALKGGFHGWKNAGYPIEVGSIDDPVQVHFSDASNSPDGTVSINVTLNTNKKPVSIISLEIGFEPNLLTNPGVVISPIIKQGTPTDRILSTITPAEGILRLDFKPASQTRASLNAIIPDGVIATVTFDVAPETKSGTKVNLNVAPDAMDSKKRFFRTIGQNTTIIIESVAAINSISMKEHGMEMSAEEQASDKVRCAIKGMEIKKSAMVEMEHDGRTLYFCSKEQMEMFEKNPTKYLRVISIGNIDVNINILTRELMETMGMSDMMMEIEGMDKATHYISAYLTDKKTGVFIPAHSVDKDSGKKMENFKIQIIVISSDGEVQKPQMNYVEMMKYHAAGFNLAKSGNYKIKVILEAADIEL